jgi:hypothetical protein
MASQAIQDSKWVVAGRELGTPKKKKSTGSEERCFPLADF